MSYRPGELNNKVTMQSRVVGNDGSGGQAISWVDVRDEFALVRPLSGGEIPAADRTEAKAGYLVVLRARFDYTEKNRAVWGDRILNIKQVKTRAPRSTYLELVCELGGAT